MRAMIAVIAAIAFGGYAFAFLCLHPFLEGNDFTYPWVAARAVRQGIDPYIAVHSRHMPWGPDLFYPFPAALVALPFSFLDARPAGALFAALGVGLLTFALTRDDVSRVAILLCAPVLRAAESVQWSPLLTAAALMPVGLGIAACKPNFGLPLIAYQSSRWALLSGVVGVLAFLLVSFAIQPSWFAHWSGVFRTTRDAGEFHIPLLQTFGWPLALAALKWRRREGRLLLAMSCVPQNGYFYDQLPVLLVAHSRREAMLLAVTSHVAVFVAGHGTSDATTLAGHSTYLFPYVLLGIYLPALIIVLRRPNVADDLRRSAT